MLEDKLDRMIELLELILRKLNCPCRQPWYPQYPYIQYDPWYVESGDSTTDTGRPDEVYTK